MWLILRAFLFNYVISSLVTNLRVQSYRSTASELPSVAQQAARQAITLPELPNAVDLEEMNLPDVSLQQRNMANSALQMQMPLNTALANANLQEMAFEVGNEWMVFEPMAVSQQAAGAVPQSPLPELRSAFPLHTPEQLRHDQAPSVDNTPMTAGGNVSAAKSALSGPSDFDIDLAPMTDAMNFDDALLGSPSQGQAALGDVPAMMDVEFGLDAMPADMSAASTTNGGREESSVLLHAPSEDVIPDVTVPRKKSKQTGVEGGGGGGGGGGGKSVGQERKRKAVAVMDGENTQIDSVTFKRGLEKGATGDLLRELEFGAGTVPLLTVQQMAEWNFTRLSMLPSSFGFNQTAQSYLQVLHDRQVAVGSKVAKRVNGASIRESSQHPTDDDGISLNGSVFQHLVNEPGNLSLLDDGMEEMQHHSFEQDAMVGVSTPLMGENDSFAETPAQNLDLSQPSQGLSRVALCPDMETLLSDLPDGKDCIFQDVMEGKSRAAVATSFFQLLALTSRQQLQVAQENQMEYGAIRVSRA
jgi:hypothetical protein